MLSQAAYFEIRGMVAAQIVATVRHDDRSSPVDIEIIDFLNPYVLIMHDDGRGFYLNRQYQHILDVKDCQIPEDIRRFMGGFLITGNHLPSWALQYPHKDFTTYWLY